MFIELRDDIGATVLVNTDFVVSLVVINWGANFPHRGRVNVVFNDGTVQRDLIVPGVDKPTGETAHQGVYNLLTQLTGGRKP